MLRRVVTALIEVELEELRRAHHVVPAVAARAVADDVLRHFDAIPKGSRDLLTLALESLDVALPPFTWRSLGDRVQFLRHARWGGVPWQGLSYALSLVWLVFYSHPDVVRALPAGVVSDPPAAVPDDFVAPVVTDAPVAADYDACVIGSGAAGALVAYRLGAEGHRVLLVDSGRWLPPQSLGPRHDHSLAGLYKGAGVQPALPDLAALVHGSPAGVNFLQANVFGGGPQVNNAIQLPMDRTRFEQVWRPRGFPFAWEELAAGMLRVARDLQFDASALDPTAIGSPRAAVRPGARSERLSAAVRALWPGAAANPVSMWDCVGCGACNLGCRYNRKSGGVHGPRAAGAPSSYLMRAIRETGDRVALRSELRAIRFELDDGGRVTHLVARDLRSNELLAVKARAFVVAAGPVASSRLLQDSHLSRPKGAVAFGTRIAANVTTFVASTMSQPIGATPPLPGTQMCFYVEPETGQLLEGWFDAPGGIATATSGLPAETADFVGDYARANILGVVVPIDDLATVQPGPIEITAHVSDTSFRRILRAIAHAGEALHRAGAVRVTPGHRLNTNVGGALVVDATDALAGRTDAIVDALARRLTGPQDLSLQTPHPQGGNNIADSPTRGPVAPSFKVFGTANLFVADSSLFPAGCGRNPQLTTMGLAHLAATGIARCLTQDDLHTKAV